MESLLIIAEVIALLCLSTLCIYLIVVLLRVRDTLASLENNFKEITTRALPVLENLEFITSRVKGIAENIDDQVSLVRESIGSLKLIADNIVDLERKIQDRIEGPLLESIAFIAAMFRGVRTFLDRFRA